MSAAQSLLTFIQQKGPVLPAQASKHLGQSLLMTSVHLAELSSTGKLKVSSLKVGGSPLYYLEGQESQLERFSDNLNEKEQRAYNLLQKKQVLRDSDLEPLYRVALRNTKDFATALTVSYNSTQEIFWKWHTVPNEEAEKIIRGMLDISKPQSIEEQATPPPPGEAIPAEPRARPIPGQSSTPGAAEATAPALERSPRQLQQETPAQSSPGQTQEAAQRPKWADAEKTHEEQPKQEERAQPKPQQDQAPTQKRKQTQGDEFADALHSFFGKHGIEILEEKRLRRNADLEFTIAVPSPLGKTEHYCRAKNKKRISDSDLSTALVQGQIKKLPVVLLTTGEPTKKAQEMLDSELKGITLKRLD